MASERKGSVKVLHFQAQDMCCCLDLQYIEKILPLPLLGLVPGGPVPFAGLMNLKNKSIPVFDLALALGLKREENYSLNTLVLLCRDNSLQLGLIVDKVARLGEVDWEQIENHEDFIRSNTPFLGTVALPHGISLILDSDWLFALKMNQDIKALES